MSTEFTDWKKSSRSGTQSDCVEVGWRKSSYSGPSGNCIEIGFAVEAVGVRDTKDREGGQLTLAPARWQSFLATLKHGIYDR